MMFEKIQEALDKRREDERKAWAEYSETVECRKPAECWCPLCDPQSYGGVGPMFGPLYVDHNFTCPGCKAEMGQVVVRDDQSVHCPRCQASL